MGHTEREERIAAYWERNSIFEKSVAQRPKEQQYVFYDGPPFATGVPHYGHILGLTSKDLFPRFWTMRGYRVERRWGWDCHGLPIENIAERELGVKEKREIERMGIGKFNEFCRSKVLFYAGEWKKTVRRMGKWIEFDNSYKTMDNSYMETVWWIFKEFYKKGYLFEGKKILLYCPRCQTPLSNAEIAMDNSYRNVTEKTATVKFKMKGEEDTYFLAWTTTPWTLIGNVGLAINPSLKYVMILQDGEFYILAKSRLRDVVDRYEMIEEFPGTDLIGKEYEPLYQLPSDQIPSDKKGHYVIDGGSEVNADDGTGIVHMAIYGEFDYQMIQKYDLPIIQHLGPDGKLLLGPKEWIGKWFKDVDHEVIRDLEARKLLYAAEEYSHQYPFCYRCETPLVYNAVNSWFVNIRKAKQRLIERNDEISWYPAHLKHGRFLHILETAPDWSISRNRFWATALPVWNCASCGHREIIGSVQELQQKATTKVTDDIDLHKHVVDGIRLRCRCGKEMERIPEVFDCWFESGSMPYAAKHYPFENQRWLEENYPADFISEYIAQVRAWFYYMHVIGVILMDKAPFKHVVVSGNILAADGTKMSKSKGNYPDPALIFDKYGADALRFYLMASPLMKAEDLNFQEEGVQEAYRKVILLLENVLNFYRLFSGKDSRLDGKEHRAKERTAHVLDLWILSRMHTTAGEATAALESYNTPEYCRLIVDFINELSTWYVRRSRDRFKAADAHAIATLHEVLLTLAKIVAPLMPFIAEEIYLQLTSGESVHLEQWPEPNKARIDVGLEERMRVLRDLVHEAMELRESAKIPVRQPLARLVIGTSLPDGYLDILKDEINVKEIVVVPGTKAMLETVVTEELREEGTAREFIRKINSYRRDLGLTINDDVVLTVQTEDVHVRKSVERFAEQIRAAVHARNIVFGGDVEKKLAVGSATVHVGIRNS